MSWLQEAQFESAVPVPASLDRVAELSLTPQEGFVLSRVDGHSSIEEICLMTGLPREETLAALGKLHAVGVIRVPGAPAAAFGGGDSAAAGRTGAAAGSGPPSGASSRAGSLRANAEVSDGADFPPFTPDPDCELSEEKQREIHDFYHRMGDMDFFRLLGLERGCSGRDVQRAYRKISLRYHPDRFFGKKLGRTKELLEGIFRHLSNVADYLTDDEQRAAYEAEIAPVTPSEGTTAVSGDAAADATGPQTPPAFRGDAGRAPDGAEQAARRREMTQEDRLRRLGGVLGMTTQEIRAVARKRKRPRQAEGSDGAASSREAEEAAARRRKRRRTATAQRVLSPLIQRKQKARVHFEEGVRAMLQNKWAAAASSLKLAVTFDPTNQEYQDKERIATARAREESARSYSKRAAMEEGMGRFEEAARLYCMAAERHELEHYLVKASELLVHTGDLKQAVDYGKKAVALDPNSVPARVALAAAYLAAGMPRNARREVDYALKLDSDNRMAKRLLKDIRRRDSGSGR